MTDSKDFFRNLPALSDFTEVTNNDRYTALPDDWLLILTDIKGSTQAIRDPKASKERVARGEHDFGFFAHTYFPHYLTGPDSEFHEFLQAYLPGITFGDGGAREALAAPRGNAKSVYGQIFITWVTIYKHRHFPIIFSDAKPIAAALLEGIKAEYEVNPRLAQDFPDACGEGPKWQYAEIITRHGVMIMAAGSNKRVRGARHGTRRPDLVWLDDLENDENVKKPEQRDKLESWIDKTVEPLGPPDGSMDIIYVGTVLHVDSVLNRKMKDPAWRHHHFQAIKSWPENMGLWDEWENIFNTEGQDAADDYYQDNRAEMDAGAEVIWPAVQTLIRLMKIRRRIKRKNFDCEYQNQPINNEDALFPEFTFWVHELSGWIFYGVCDPSLGKQARIGRGDPSALLVGGFDRDTGILDVLVADIKRRVPSKIIADIIKYQKIFNCLKWGVESVAFQEFFRQELVKQSAALGVPIPAMPVQSITDKTLRIESLEPHVANSLIRFRQDQKTLLDQLRYFPEADHDDGPDALEMLWALATKGGNITDMRTGGKRVMQPSLGRTFGRGSRISFGDY